jgi:hypothetical protein
MKLQDLNEMIKADVPWLRQNIEALQKRRERIVREGGDPWFADKLLAKLEKALKAAEVANESLNEGAEREAIYAQMIDKIAHQVFDADMGGSMQPWHGVSASLGLLKSVFREKNVMKDAEHQADKLRSQYYEDYNKRMEMKKKGKRVTEGKTVRAKLPKAPRMKHLHTVMAGRKAGGHYTEKTDYKRAKEKQKFHKEMKDQ